MQCSREKYCARFFDPVRVGDDYRIRPNQKLFALFNEMDDAKRNNMQRFRWLGYVVRFDEEASPRRVFGVVVGGGRWSSAEGTTAYALEIPG